MFTKTRTLFFLTLTVIVSLLLTACGSSPQPPDTTEPAASSTAEKGITIVIAEDPPSFNPMVADTGYDALVM